MTDTVLFEQSGHIARITLNNPDRHNSLGGDELKALQAHFDAVEADASVRVLVVTGNGDKTFCAGASLGQLSGGEIAPDFFQQTTDKLAALRVPTICALNGSVFGGGVELALSCDFRIGVRGSRLRVPAAQIGLCYPLSGINRFVERLGVNLAKRVLVAAEEFSDEEMLALGFLDHLVPRAALDASTNAMAGRIAGLAPLAVQSMKAILQQAAGGGIDTARAQALSQACADSDDLQEGFAAQREKRTPDFKGK